MMNSKNCVTKLGVKDITTCELICLKTKKKVNIVFSMKTKPHILTLFPKVNLFNRILNVST